MITTAIEELCKLYYDENTMKHAERVANEARSLCDLFKLHYVNYNDFVYQLGLAHDLYEDTEIKQGVWFDTDFEKNLQLLTKGKSESYNDYITRIRMKAVDDPRYIPAYIVKLADIHDHLAQTETLTDRLKNKYLAALPYLI